MDGSSYVPKSVDISAIAALLDSFSLPKPAAITKLNSQGQYHLIYVLEYEPTVLEGIVKKDKKSRTHLDHRSRLLLRIAGNSLPARRTENEAAILAYISQNALNIPIPTIVHHDSSNKNPLGHEYQIMTVCLGVEVDSIFRTWDQATKVDFLDQIIELLQRLHSIPADKIGGFRFVDQTSRNVDFGSLCEEYLWQGPGIEEHWHKHGLQETPESLNAQGPFDTWTQLNAAWLEKYIYAIERHPFMVEFRDMIPLLTRFVTLLRSSGLPEWSLNEMRIVLAHRDLHFGNILYHDGRISGIIDWEFAGSAPFCKWDPPRAFLASLPYDEEGLQRKRDWVKDFQNRCEARDIDWRQLIFDPEKGWSTEQQRLVHEAMDYMRCIFEVGPTGKRIESVRAWRRIVEERLDRLGIS